MNDVETRLTDHLRATAEAIHPTDRLAQLHAEAAAASRRRADHRRSFVARPAWLGIAAGAVAVAGVGAAFLSRSSESPPSPTVPPDAQPVSPGPTINDHWHEAYAFWICGRWVTLDGTLEDAPTNQVYITTGIHSHDDGVIHIHPFSTAGSGPNATLGAFLAGYGVELTDDSLQFPPEQGGNVAMTCDGQAAELSVTVWPDAADPSRSVTYTDDLADVPLRDRAAMTIAVGPPSTPVPMPGVAAQLDLLGAVDSGGVTTTP